MNLTKIIPTVTIGIICLFLFVAFIIKPEGFKKPRNPAPAQPPAQSPPPQSWQHLAGGTLHNATITQWHEATPQNRLATAADHIATLYPTLTMQQIEARAHILIETISLIMRPGEPRPDHPMPKVFAMFIPTLEIEHGWRNPAR